ncbi:MAG: anthranilate phosphoribosyltransferase, partial [Alphaproteobacteria bacterium]|nr:anthranilate phosphoribosyltransferase [Alphaproteobacteria bacterium]
PEDAGLARASAADLKGGDPQTNAAALRAVLDGAQNAYRDIALINAAAALVIADKAKDLKEGVALGAQAIASGKAKATLAKLAETSNRPVQ